MAVKALTERQKDILEWIRLFTATEGYSPSYREIANAFKIKSVNGVRLHLLALRNKALLDFKDAAARTIRVVDKEPKGWQPIADAPLNLEFKKWLCFDDVIGRYMVCHWDGTYWIEGGNDRNPTHFMALPPPPSTSEGETR